MPRIYISPAWLFCAIALAGRAILAQETDGLRGNDQMIEGAAPVYTSTAATTAAPTSPIAASPASEILFDSVDAPVITEINLPSALAMIGGKHPAVGFAQWRVREAYAELDQARVLWLPSIRAGFSYHRHDGNYQASDGRVVDVNRSSLQSGLGFAATGAGTTPLPGVTAQFHFADAIFRPRVAQKRAWSASHAAGAALNRQLAEAAIAYTNLTGAFQRRAVMGQAHQQIAELAKLTRDFAEAGQGLQSDADRLATERMLVENRWVASEEEVAVASARLAESLHADPTVRFVPTDPTVAPIAMINATRDRNDLIRLGLTQRPELKEAGALVAAACDEHRRQRYAPFVPSVLLGFTTGAFGGGLGNTIADTDGRYDFDAVVSWELRNFGLGEQAARRREKARVQQARYEQLQLMDRVAREVAAAHARTVFRRRQVEITGQTIETAENSYQRNLSRIRDGQGLPLEVLQSVRALEEAKLAYVTALVAHNVAQFELHWSTGLAISAEQMNR